MEDLLTASPASENDPLSSIKLFTEASAVFVAITFVTGWSYLAAYYRTFGVNPLDLDVAVPVAATIALHVFYEAVWPVPVAIITFTLIVLIIRRFTPRQRGRRALTLALLVITMFFLAFSALNLGRKVANMDMREESSNLPLIAFSSKSESAKSGDPDQPSCVGFQAFGQMDCKFLLHSKGVYYFFRPIPKKALAAEVSNINVYMLPDSEVLGIHVQRGVNFVKGAK